MSRPGYTNALRAILEGQPALARPILEILEVIATDLKTTEADYNGADSLLGLEVITGGGVRLAEDVTTSYIDNVTAFVADAGNAIDLDNRPTASGLIGVAVCVWKDDRNKPIIRGEAVIDLVGGAGEATTLTAQLFRLAIIEEVQGPPFAALLELEPLTQPITVPAVSGTVEFLFDPEGTGAIVCGDPFLINPPFGGSGVDPFTIMFVWGTQDDGSPATVGIWEADNKNGTFPDPGGSTQQMFGFDLVYTGSDYGSTNDERDGIPGFSIKGAGYQSASIEWTTNPIDLGQAPEADTELQLELLTVTPSDTLVDAEIKEAGAVVGDYTFFKNADVIGVDNTPTGGNDLSGVPRVQSYDIRVKLAPSLNLAVTPQLLRVGVNEVNSTIVDGEIDVTSYDAACDPITCVAEVSTASVVIRRDGVKDYRSFGEELFSDNDFAAVTMRIFIGHDQIARSDWLIVDTFKVRNMDPGGDGLAIDLISSLFDVLAAFPPTGSRTSPDLYTFTATDVGAAWVEIHATLGIPDNLVGQGPPATATTEARVLTEIGQAIDLRTELDYIAAGVTISRQGAFEFRSLFDATPPDPALQIDLAEYEVIGWDQGTDRRLTEVQIIFPDPGSDQFTEKAYSAPSEVVAAWGTLGGGQPTVISGSVMEWVPELPFNEQIGDAVGERLVDNFGPGLQQIRLRTRTPRPQIELGDVLLLDQDRLIQRDPFSDAPVRGRSLSTCRVVGVHDIMGTELTLWLQPAFLGTPQASAATAIAASASGVVEQKTALVRHPGEAFRPSRWAADYAAETGAGGNLQKVLARWERFGGRLECESNADGQAPRCVLPLTFVEHALIRQVKMAASIPLGTLDVELARYPVDGSPRTVIETFTFTNTVGRDLQEKILSPFHVVDAESTYTVEVTCPLLDDGETFEIYAFALLITEVF